MDDIKTMGAAVAADVIKDLAKDMASFIAAKVKDYCVDASNKELVDSGSAFVEYLGKTRETYSKSKTVLYRNEAKDLRKFYVPLNLRYKGNEHVILIYSDDPLVSSGSLKDVLKKGSKVLITGIGGMGKTILMKHFCVNAIDSCYKIPVFVSLRWFNDMVIEDEPLEKQIYDRLSINGFKLDYEYFKYSLDGDKYVFLLDGYDEISRDKQPVITRKISDFTRKYSGNSFVMSSRPIERVYCWEQYRILDLCPMTEEQALKLILKLDFDSASKAKFIGELKNGLYKEYESLISVPLILSILFVTYVEQATIPRTLQEFYEKAFESLLYRYDQMKEGYERVLGSGLGYEDFRKVFLTFCFITYFKEEYEFSDAVFLQRISEAGKAAKIEFNERDYKSDIVDIACMLIKDGLKYTFIHRCFQEYFAAYYVSIQTDDKQGKLCSALIHSHFSESIQFGDTLGTYVKDFLDMLYSIEPIRFEHIVLQPIRAKIKETYESRDCSLLNAVSKYFVIIPEYCGTDYAWAAYGLRNTEDMKILFHFHDFIIDPYDEITDDVMAWQVSDVVEDDVRNVLIKDLTIMKPNSIPESTGDSCLEIARYLMKTFAMEIQRYDILLSQSKANGELQDIISSFLQ